MTDELRDPILEACLEEIYGGAIPPDLKGRILRKLDQLPPQSVRLRRDLLRDVRPAENGDSRPQVVARPALERVTARRQPSRWQGQRWQAGVLAAAVVLVAAVCWGVAFLAQPPAVIPAPAPIAEVESTPTEDFTGEDFQFTKPAAPAVVERAVPPTPISPPSAAEPLDRWPEERIVAVVNQQLAATWRSHDVQPAGAISQEQWLTRLFRRVLGREPRDGELQRWLREERSLVLDALLAGAYRSEFAEHFASAWTGVLLSGRRVGTPGNDAALRGHLRQGLQRGQSWAEVTGELLTARGDQGPATYLLTHWTGDASSATGHAGRIFLGQQLVCAKCHDHPTDQLAQADFWQLNAFFRQTQVRGGKLIDGDLPGVNAAEAPIYYETPDGRLQAAYPDLAGTPTVPRSGRLSEVDRRRQLATALVATDAYRRAMVDRMWSFLFQYGLATGATSAAHQQTLDTLAMQFAAHDYQLDSLVRWLVLTDAFSRQASDDPRGDRPEMGTLALFSHDYRRSETQTTASRLAALETWRNELHSPRPEVARRAPALPQDRNKPPLLVGPADRVARDLAADPRIDRAFHQGPPPLVTRVLASSLSLTEKVDHLFLLILQRQPSSQERALVDRILSKFSDDSRGLTEVWWALRNSDEAVHTAG